MVAFWAAVCCEMESRIDDEETEDEEEDSDDDANSMERETKSQSELKIHLLNFVNHVHETEDDLQSVAVKNVSHDGSHDEVDSL